MPEDLAFPDRKMLALIRKMDLAKGRTAYVGLRNRARTYRTLSERTDLGWFVLETRQGSYVFDLTRKTTEF